MFKSDEEWQDFKDDIRIQAEIHSIVKSEMNMLVDIIRGSKLTDDEISDILTIPSRTIELLREVCDEYSKEEFDKEFTDEIEKEYYIRGRIIGRIEISINLLRYKRFQTDEIAELTGISEELAEKISERISTIARSYYD